MKKKLFDSVLPQTQKQYWDENGYLILPQYFSPQQVQSMTQWTEETASWPETPGLWMKYYEPSHLNQHTQLLARVENFVPYHEGFRQVISDSSILSILQELFGEEAVLFKEKINFKAPGGGGFTAHQDAPAFISFQQTFHITMMIPIDPMTAENGALEMVSQFRPNTLLAQEADGTLSKEIEAKHTWTPLYLKPGDLLFFDSYVLHRSMINHSAQSRRALYVTYNGKSQGAKRETYFQLKREHFPPIYERIAGIDYHKKSSIFNLGNPIQ
jgi:hypothetical protein